MVALQVCACLVGEGGRGRGEGGACAAQLPNALCHAWTYPEAPWPHGLWRQEEWFVPFDDERINDQDRWLVAQSLQMGTCTVLYPAAGLLSFRPLTYCHMRTGGLAGTKQCVSNSSGMGRGALRATVWRPLRRIVLLCTMQGRGRGGLSCGSHLVQQAAKGASSGFTCTAM